MVHKHGCGYGSEYKKKNNTKQNRGKDALRTKGSVLQKLQNRISFARERILILSVFTVLFGRRCYECRWTSTELSSSHGLPINWYIDAFVKPAQGIVKQNVERPRSLFLFHNTDVLQSIWEGTNLWDKSLSISRRHHVTTDKRNRWKNFKGITYTAHRQAL